jgi:hypothetical protein
MCTTDLCGPNKRSFFVLQSFLFHLRSVLLVPLEVGVRGGLVSNCTSCMFFVVTMIVPDTSNVCWPCLPRPGYCV